MSNHKDPFKDVVISALITPYLARNSVNAQEMRTLNADTKVLQDQVERLSNRLTQIGANNFSLSQKLNRIRQGAAFTYWLVSFAVIGVTASLILQGR